MKIALLKHIGDLGVITGWKPLLPDRVKVEIGEDGVLTVGHKAYRTQDGSVIFHEYEMMPGNNHVVFNADDGRVYRCGTINRNGRFMTAINHVDEINALLAVAYEKQALEIEQLRAEIAEKERQRSIKII